MAETKKTTKAAAATEPKTPVTGKVSEPDGLVRILYIDSAMKNNEIAIGNGKKMTGSGRIFQKTLDEFEGEFMTRQTQMLLEQKKFIVLSGLTEDQREMYGCLYNPGEVITDATILLRILDKGIDFATEVFTALCKEHREMVCSRLISAYEDGDNRVTYELVRALNSIAVADYPDGKSPLSELFTKLATKG